MHGADWHLEPLQWMRESLFNEAPDLLRLQELCTMSSA